MQMKNQLTFLNTHAHKVLYVIKSLGCIVHFETQISSRHFDICNWWCVDHSLFFPD